MINFNSYNVLVYGMFAILCQGCTLDEKTTLAGDYQDESNWNKSTIGTHAALIEFKEKVKRLEDSLVVQLSPDSLYLGDEDEQVQKLLVLYQDEDKTPHRLYVWDLTEQKEEFSCCFSGGELLGIKHMNQECFFAKGRMQLWLDEKGKPLPIRDTEEWLDQSNTMIKLAENYLGNFKK